MKGINRVLIANRGEIACRIIRTLDRMGISSVLVCHPCEARGPAARMAKEVIEIDADPPVSAYLDTEALVEACRSSGADALHPGFGFLAENASFAKRLEEEGIVFIGPTPEAISLMGNKPAARDFVRSLGLPVIPAEGDGDGFYERLQLLGFPLLIKAAAGGGGKAMHRVFSAGELEHALELSREEAARYFGDRSIYAERLLHEPRHIEVQILSDGMGRVLHLWERDCSIQRRFQKIVEESPAPGLNPGLRREILSAAVRIAKEAGYKSAGTVEFLVEKGGGFYFLEMNTRIQVEHPVTEMVTGLDLIELQVRIASGERLAFSQEDVPLKGHAIEARLYAEDPDCDFQPSTGRILSLRLPEGQGIRVDHAIERGMRVTHAFDPMLAKIIAHGREREEALRRLSTALEEMVLLGVKTNRAFLKRIIENTSMKEGKIHTGFLSSEDIMRAEPSRRHMEMLLAAAALSSRDLSDPQFLPPEPYASMGPWRN
jgi:propionyl-CoA carboxylase alpha chain/3-methylcrotonyl-CoA carboxylase alpha subunit/acetyl-CoA/propionyl-CoA carboxylase biotin carboxyl carrier protein